MGISVAIELWLCTSKELDEVKDCAVVTVKDPVNNNNNKKSDMTYLTQYYLFY